MSRRRLLGAVAGAGLLAGSNARAAPPPPDAAAKQRLAELAARFLQAEETPGLSIAFAYRGQFLHADAFGFANRDSGERASTQHLFRIAAVSMPITAAAIFTLIDAGKLELDAPVFGPQGILTPQFGVGHPKSRLATITVDHLLTHTVGAWSNRADDPMFSDPTVPLLQLIETTLKNVPLTQPAGRTFTFSNFGFSLLGRVIEAVSKQPYAEYVQRHVLQPCGIKDMRIASNNRGAPGEVHYTDRDYLRPYLLNVERMDAHGGWVATPTDLLRFVTCLDPLSGGFQLLREESRARMLSPTTVTPWYGRGWMLNARTKIWWHNGSMPGTNAVLVRAPDGFVWAALTNGRRARDTDALDALLWNMRRAVPAWQS